MNTGTTSRMPALFIEHGSPMALDDKPWQADLHGVAQALPRPKAVLIFSAHWQEAGLCLGATRTVPLLYDFYGFPEEYYRVTYQPPPAPELARRVEALVKPLGPVRRTDRGLDHGAFIPLMAMYPEADIPVLQMALPSEDPQALLALGKALAPLRDEGALILGGGYLIHNLRLARMGGTGAPPPWAVEFDAWVEDKLRKRDVGALTRFASEAPHAQTALPTAEHFLPLLIPLGASTPEDAVNFPVTGYILGPFTRRSVRWG